MFEEYPDLEWIELLDCPGSLDDDACRSRSASSCSRCEYTCATDGEIYSVGCRLLYCCVEREYLDGGVVGVHSWSDGRVEGADLPVDAPVHDLYLDYYEDMGAPTDFIGLPQCQITMACMK